MGCFVNGKRCVGCDEVIRSYFREKHFLRLKLVEALKKKIYKKLRSCFGAPQMVLGMPWVRQTMPIIIEKYLEGKALSIREKSALDLYDYYDRKNEEYDKLIYEKFKKFWDKVEESR